MQIAVGRRSSRSSDRGRSPPARQPVRPAEAFPREPGRRRPRRSRGADPVRSSARGAGKGSRPRGARRRAARRGRTRGDRRGSAPRRRRAPRHSARRVGGSRPRARRRGRRRSAHRSVRGACERHPRVGNRMRDGGLEGESERIGPKRRLAVDEGDCAHGPKCSCPSGRRAPYGNRPAALTSGLARWRDRPRARRALRAPRFSRPSGALDPGRSSSGGPGRRGGRLASVRIRDDAMRPSVPRIERLGRLRRVLQVEPEDDHAAAVLFDELAQDRRLARAGVAPGRPDVDDDRPLLHAREDDPGAGDRVGAGQARSGRIDPDGSGRGRRWPSASSLPASRKRPRTIPPAPRSNAIRATSRRRRVDTRATLSVLAGA